MDSISIIIKCLILCTVLGLLLAQEGPFKINKLNLIYAKAHHSLGPGKLKDLKEDLNRHEADELNLKKLKAHNQDKDGLLEATVRKKLLSIMARYSLERHFEEVNFNPKKDQIQHDSKKPIEQRTFRDSKLDKLWKKAEKAGFTQDQLMILHEEFQHQQDKLDDHYETLNIMEEEIERNARRQSKLENSIEVPSEDSFKKESKSRKKYQPNSEEPSEKKARLDENIHQGLKEKHNEIKKAYSELSKKIATGAIDVDQPFQDGRVNELWSLAVQSNFSTSELESIKEELMHYQTRIEKLKHFQNQLERQKITSKGSKSYAEDDTETKHIKKKVDELTMKVDKTDKTIEKKIMRDEL